MGAHQQGGGLRGLFMRRVVNAGLYSWRGLRAGWRSEEALRVELIVSAVLIPLALSLNVTTVERILLIAVLLLVLIVELLNSAVEAAVDRISGEIHELSGKAKDMGSAAVLIALLLAALAWGMILFL